MGRWQPKPHEQPVGSIKIDLAAVGKLYVYMVRTLGLNVFGDWTDAHGKRHNYDAELTIMGNPTVPERDGDICRYGRALAIIDIDAMYLGKDSNVYNSKTPSLPAHRSPETMQRNRTTALLQRDSTDEEAIDNAFTGRAACEYYIALYIAQANLNKEKYADKLTDKKYVGSGDSAAVPFGTIAVMKTMIHLWRMLDQGRFARQAHGDDLFISSDNNPILREAMGILPTMNSQLERDQSAIQLAQSKLTTMPKMQINESPVSQKKSTHESALGIPHGASAEDALAAFLSKVIACNFSWNFLRKGYFNRVSDAIF